MNTSALHVDSSPDDDLLVETRRSPRVLTPAGKTSARPSDETACDASLLERAKAGDAHAFRALYERHHASVAAVCRRWLGDRELVEDAVQETFLRAWARLDQFVGTDLGPWLRRIAKHHCHDIWRRRPPFEITGEHIADGPDPAPRDLLEAVAVQRVLAGLDPRDASMLIQRHVADVPVAALASRFGITRASMDVALHRARTRARRLASAEGLRTLLPIGLPRRLAALVQRWAGPSGSTVGAAVADAAAPVLIAVGLAIPGMGIAQAVPPRPVVSGEVRTMASQDLPRMALPARDVARRHDVVTAPATGDEFRQPHRARVSSQSPAAKPHVTSQRPAPVALDPVAVPGTNRKVHNDPDWEQPDQRVGVRVEAGGDGGSHQVEMHSSHENDELAPVARTACAVATAAPLTYCETTP